MEEKDIFTAKEVAEGLLKKAQDFVKSEIQKADPRNQSSAQMAEVSIPQPKAPQAQEKMIAKQPLQLKKFMEKCQMKKMAKNGN